jgi:hypothetical protein
LRGLAQRHLGNFFCGIHIVAEPRQCKAVQAPEMIVKETPERLLVACKHLFYKVFILSV